MSSERCNVLENGLLLSVGKLTVLKSRFICHQTSCIIQKTSRM